VGDNGECAPSFYFVAVFHSAGKGTSGMNMMLKSAVVIKVNYIVWFLKSKTPDKPGFL
jgi:hypothetical protein